MSYRSKQLGLGTKLILAGTVALVIITLTAGKGNSTTTVATNRCPVTTTPNSVSYSCWSAYPEAFYVSGYAKSSYRLSWKVSCIGVGLSVSGNKNIGGGFKVIVNQFTQPAAYRLMISNDVCKIDVVAKRTAGNGSITMRLVVNQNHAPGAHN